MPLLQLSNLLGGTTAIGAILSPLTYRGGVSKRGIARLDRYFGRRCHANDIPKLLVVPISQRRLKLRFRRPFLVKGIDRPLPPGDYEIVPDHQLTGELWFPAYRPIVTLLCVPPQPYRRSSIVKANVRLSDILASHERDQLDIVETNCACRTI